MSNLFGTMSLAVRALLAEQGALETTANNVANIHTPGYARQRPLLLEGDPVVIGRLVLGSGVVLGQAETLREPILELRMHEETQQQGQLDAMVAALRQIEVSFNENSGDIGSRLSRFFNSLNELSTNPANLPLRQGVLTAAENLAAAFRANAHNLKLQQANLDLETSQAVDQINVLTGQVADLNRQISGMESLGQDANIFISQRTVLIRKLSALVDVRVIDSRPGLSLTTANGTALVAGDRSFQLQAGMDPLGSGLHHVFAQGTDVTANLTAGKLAGLIKVRDQTIPSLLLDLDTLASGLSNALNAAHATGFDLSGNPGGNLFAPPPLALSGAAAAMSVAISDPTLIAASSDGSSGSNGNLDVLSAVRTQAVARGQNPTDFYAGLVFHVGSDVANSSAEAEAAGLILHQLENQRSAVSGVSLDEEAANLVRFQRAYEAAARVVATINDLTDIAINLGRY